LHILTHSLITDEFVDHIGYVSLFPLLFGLIPIDSPRLGHILHLMENDALLKSPYGLRSLSKSDPLFGTQENYWRGPIWVNINYLALRALNRYYVSVEGPYSEQARNVYNVLRRNLIANIFKVWKRTGDQYEQYSAITGSGQGQHPFAGWTSLIVLIMAEMY
jgi:mannosyl-oligosaccharide glucosidase